MAVPYSSCEFSAGMTRGTVQILPAVLNSFSFQIPKLHLAEMPCPKNVFGELFFFP